MKNGIKNILCFCFGGVIGGGVTYFLLKKKFDARVDEEVQSVKDLYSSKFEEINNTKNNENSNAEVTEKKEDKASENKSKSFKNSIKKQEKQAPIDYANYYSNSNGGNVNAKENDNTQKAAEVVPEKKPSKKSYPVVISPDEFEDDEDYETIYLTYYSDGVLADEMDNPVKVESTIGKGALKHFGEYEDDLLHVRDDKAKIYYEIAKDNRKFSDVSGGDSDGDEED